MFQATKIVVLCDSSNGKQPCSLQAGWIRATGSGRTPRSSHELSQLPSSRAGLMALFLVHLHSGAQDSS